MLPLTSLWQKQNSGGLVLGRIGNGILSPLSRVRYESRSAHMNVIGLSWRGKTKMLEHCIFQDITANMGCGLLDPHSLLVDDLLRLLVTKGVAANPDILNNIIYVDPSREDYVVPFNVLATPETPYKVATAVLEAFRRTWPDSLREAPHFSNLMLHALLLLIKVKLTLVQLPRLLVDKEFREELLDEANEPELTEYFHTRFDEWGKEAPVMRESSLNKVTALTVNPHLKMMLGQEKNHLDFARIMDEGKVLLLDLGRSDGETNRLIGSLVMTGLELAMRRRKRRTLWNLTIDEFAAYVANEGSIQTLSHVFSEGRKFRMSMTVAHQDLSQLTPRMIGALSNVRTKVIFGIGRYDAEFFSKIMGHVDTEAIKREAKTDTQHEVFSTIPEQWEKWVDTLRYQKPRSAVVSLHDDRVYSITTMPIPPYTASEEGIEAVRLHSLKRHGIPHEEARKNLHSEHSSPSQDVSIAEYELVNEQQYSPKKQ